MAVANSWDDANKQAMKILGNKAKIPQPKPGVTKSAESVAKTMKEYDKAVSVLQDKIVELQDTYSSWGHAIKQFTDQIEKSDFGLDGKSADDKKKIKDATDILTDYLEAQVANLDVNNKNLDELDKHTMSLSKYKPKE